MHAVRPLMTSFIHWSIVNLFHILSNNYLLFLYYSWDIITLSAVCQSATNIITHRMANLRCMLILTIASYVLDEVEAARSPIVLSKFMNCTHYNNLMYEADVSLVCTVPGFTRSQLAVKVTSYSQCSCSTDWTGLWINTTRGSTLPTCFLNELTYVSR